MPSLPPIVVRQPQPFDIVDDPVKVCGIGTGFEGNFSARVRDANGVELSLIGISAGGTGIWGNYQLSIPLGAVPATPQGTLEVFEFSPKGDGTELNKVAVPITFGRALLEPAIATSQWLRASRTCTKPSWACQIVTRLTSGNRARTFQAASASAWPSPVPYSATLRS